MKSGPAVMARKPAEERVQIRVDVDWLARVDAEAARQGLSRSAYIRWAITREMDRAERERKAQEEEE